MNYETFQFLINHIKSKVKEESVENVRITAGVEVESENEEESESESEGSLSTYVDLWKDLEVHPHFARLKLVPETEWEDPEIESRYLLLPYDSILAVTEETFLYHEENGSSKERDVIFHIIVKAELANYI